MLFIEDEENKKGIVFSRLNKDIEGNIVYKISKVKIYLLLLAYTIL